MIKLLLAALIIAGIWWFMKPRPRPVARALPDIAQARSILGLGADASAEDVRTAHRRLLSGLHPDKGGSAELTRQINTARDVLLRQAR